MDYIALGQRIRKLRRDKNMTQEQLAEVIGISASFLGHIERGSRVASLETLVKLCRMLQVSPVYLLEKDLNGAPLELPQDMRGKVYQLLRCACELVK